MLNCSPCAILWSHRLALLVGILGDCPRDHADSDLEMYNITQATKAAPGNELGIFEEGDFYAAEDLVEFFALLAPYVSSA